MSVHADPFSVRLHDGVLELTLDTPGCSHNIFSLDAACQLSRILEEADPRRVAVVLIRSGKPASFVNGVGLLMAGTAQQPEDIPAMTRDVTRAYRALREFPAPSVAAIAGNCYGCGVELALHCDYRLACESYEAHYYMTELADYLFIPAFGATQDLPRLLGVEAAADLLLWAERWSARQAVERGLVDRSFDAQEFDAGVAGFVRTLAAAPRKRTICVREPWSAKHEVHAHTTRERIRALPPAYQPVYQAAYSLMVHAAKATCVSAGDYAAELRACSESVVQPIAKASVAFFFVRRLAAHFCLRGYELPGTTAIAIDPFDECVSALHRDLAKRQVRGLDLKNTVPVSSCGASTGAGIALEFQAVPLEGEAPRHGAIGTILQPRLKPRVGTECVIYSPFFGSGASNLVEIACDATRSTVPRAAFAVFERAGYSPVLTRPQGDFATNMLLAHHLAPLIAFVAGGGAASDVHASLREFGFVRGVAPLLQLIPESLLCRWVAPFTPAGDRAICEAADELLSTTYRDGVMQTGVIDLLLVSLSVFAMEAVKGSVVPHPALVDVMARELIDFPLMHGSLCRFLGDSELARLHLQAGSATPFFSAEFTGYATRVLAEGRRFYNGVSDAVRSARPETGAEAPSLTERSEWTPRALRL